MRKFHLIFNKKYSNLRVNYFKNKRLKFIVKLSKIYIQPTYTKYEYLEFDQPNANDKRLLRSAITILLYDLFTKTEKFLKIDEESFFSWTGGARVPGTLCGAGP